MDEIRAHRMAEELLGKKVGGWELTHLCNWGKSALVFKASRNGINAALKVFDPEVIERFGRETQLGRIERELQLKGKTHPNLVRVLDGGDCPQSKHLFVAMQFVDAPNLEKVAKVVPREKIGDIISQVAQAARFLEDLDLAHRDIKPSNVAITPDFQRATLLDLGVLRPFGDPNLTDDDDKKTFIGTLRYSPPEFLLREEQDTPEGWRAITFYQLGAVLHDLIMGYPLFQDFTDPYACLVEAVHSEFPKIESDSVSPELVLLTKNCLVKQPALRLQLVGWNDFDLQHPASVTVTAAKERIRLRHTRTLTVTTLVHEPEAEQEARVRLRTLDSVRRKLDANIRIVCAGNNLFPPMEIHADQVAELEEIVIATTFAKSEEYDLQQPLCFWVRVTLLDVQSLAIAVDFMAAMSPVPLTVEVTEGRSWIPVFSGVLEDSVIRNRIENLLYLLLDKSQETGPPNDPTDVTWLVVDPIGMEGHTDE